MNNWRFWTNISLYLGNNTRYGYSYNGRQIITRMLSIEWCHFQWLWVTPNLDFKISRSLHDNLQHQITRKWYKIGLYNGRLLGVVYDLSNSAIFRDLKWPLTQISKAWAMPTFFEIWQMIITFDSWLSVFDFTRSFIWTFFSACVPLFHSDYTINPSS